MAVPDKLLTVSDDARHRRAADAFAERARSAHADAIDRLVLFGSTVRGETRGVDSDVDVFVVGDPGIEDDLRRMAYDVGLDFGVSFSLHFQSSDRFADRRDHPFVTHVLDEGHAYV